MSERLKPGQLPAHCPNCGMLIGEPEWEVFDLIGYQDDTDQPDGERLEMKNCGCGTTLSMVVDLGKPNNVLMSARNLEELMDAMMKLALKDVQHIGEVNLPTFGGVQPSDLTNVWSWDESRLLVGASLVMLRIVQR